MSLYSSLVLYGFNVKSLHRLRVYVIIFQPIVLYEVNSKGYTSIMRAECQESARHLLTSDSTLGLCSYLTHCR